MQVVPVERVKIMVFKNLCMFVFWTKVALALEGLTRMFTLEAEIIRLH